MFFIKLLIKINKQRILFFSWITSNYIRHTTFVVSWAIIIYTISSICRYAFIENPNWFFVNTRFVAFLLAVLVYVYIKHHHSTKWQNFVQQYIWDRTLSEDNNKKLENICRKASTQFNIDVVGLDQQYSKWTYIYWFTALGIFWFINTSFLYLAVAIHLIARFFRWRVWNNYRRALLYVNITEEEDIILPKWRSALLDLTAPIHRWLGIWDDLLQGLTDWGNNSKPSQTPSEIPKSEIPKSSGNTSGGRKRAHWVKFKRFYIPVCGTLGMIGAADEFWHEPPVRTGRRILVTWLKEGIYCTSETEYAKLKMLGEHGFEEITACTPGTSIPDINVVNELHAQLEDDIQEWRAQGSSRGLYTDNVRVPKSPYHEEWQLIKKANFEKKEIDNFN